MLNLVLGIVLLIAFSVPVLAAGPNQADEQTLALVVLSPGDDLQTAVRAVEAAGGKAIHLFPPDAFIARLPASAGLDGKLSGATLFHQAADPAIAADWTPSARMALAAWNALLAPPVELDTLPPEHEETLYDAFVAPAPQADALTRSTGEEESPLPGFDETSRFLFGSVAVGIVLPESNGEADPSTEDWTDGERAQVVSEIVNALDWWASLYPEANLSFVYHNAAAETVPTRVEPITRPYSDQKYWIADAMDALGFGGTNYFDRVRAYNNFLRDTYGTDWAFTIFVVDSANDPDNRFSDGYFAYAYLGGPFMVMTSGNNGYGPGNMDAVAAHEVGHIFHALDQYAAAGQSCDLTAGYLGVENQNSQAGNCASDEPSIMRGQIAPFINRQIDPYAMGQLGWQDGDGNGTPDPVDVGLVVTNVTRIEGDAPNILTFQGELAETPFPSPKYRPILINRLQEVFYRVDDGPWLPVEATDGAFDGYREAFTFTTDPLPAGTHTLTVQAVDNFGKVNEQVIATVEVEDPAAGQVETQFTGDDNQGKLTASEETTSVSGVAMQLGGGIISAVEYRLDGGAWLPAQPADGAFDSDTEYFTLSIDLAGLGEGDHLLEARAVDGWGNFDSTPAAITITVQPQTARYTLFLPLLLSN